MSDKGHHHRSLMKQSNKNFKGKSKNLERRQQTGRMEDRVTKGSATDPALKKRDRQNRAKQIQQNKRHEAQQKLRIGSRTGPPRVLALVSLHAHSSTANLRESILQYVQSVGGTIEHAPQAPFHVKSEDAKTASSVDREFKPHPLMATFSVQIDKRVQRFTLYDCPRDALAVLDVAKVADVICFTVSGANMESGAESARSAYASEDEPVDALGRHFLSLIKAQGLPAHTATIQNLKQVTPKHQLAARRIATESLHATIDPDLKAFLVDSPEDNQQFLRWVSNLRLKDIQWRDARSFLLAEAVHYTPPSAAAPSGSLAVSGYIRGKRPLSVNQLVHLTGFGDYQLSAIETYAEAERGRRDRTHSTKSGDVDMAAAAPAPAASSGVAKTTVVQVPNPEQQETLESLIPANPLATTAQDQSIITDEELAEAAREHAKNKAKKQLDKAGYYKPERKDIQSVWDEIVSDDEDEDAKLRDEDTKTEAGGDHADVDEDDDEEKMEKRKQQESDEMMWPDEVETPRDIPAKVRFTKYRGLKNFRSAVWDKYENLPVEYSRIYTFERFQQTRKRVTALPTKPAAHPSASASRRGSTDAAMTDPSSQQQPSAFGAAAPFVFAPPAGSNFAMPAPLSAPAESKTQDHMDLGHALNETAAFQFSDGVEEGTRIVLHVKDVSPEVAARIGAVFGVPTAGTAPVTALPLSLWGLLEYEHRVSVLHFLLRRHAEDLETPLKGKEPMVFSCGFRRYVGRPIFTQDGSGDKFQMERFFMKDRFSVASIYGRIMFPPAPVLAFRANFNPIDRSTLNFNPINSPSILPLGLSLGPCSTPFNPLVATGTLTSVDPNRLLIKRVIITGAPISVHKRHAVVRHMFFNPDDVRWFKPVEIWTKHGVKGMINEPRGTKGYMKCSFDRLIKQNDTVCMSLYKRQYPPWHPELFEGHL